MPFDPKADLAALAAEIALPAYAGMDEVQTANALNARTVTADVDVDTLAINRYLIGRGIEGRLAARVERVKAELAKAVNASPVVQADVNAAEAKLRILLNAQAAFTRLPTFTTSDTQTRNFVFATIDALVAEGLILNEAAPNNERARLRLMSSGQISRAEQLFGAGARIDSGDVSRAKKV